jgi:hypothetical protein
MMSSSGNGVRAALFATQTTLTACNPGKRTEKFGTPPAGEGFLEARPPEKPADPQRET